MNDTLPRYDWGQRVRAAVDLYNDGSYPECEEGALLAPAGAPGEVMQVGMHEETSTPVYMVEFMLGDGPQQARQLRRVIGCLEPELIAEQA